MAFSINRVTLLGTLGRDPEIRTLQNGNKVSNLSVATEQSWKDKSSGEWKKKTDWHNVVVWGNEKIVEALSKGSKVYVEGLLQTRKYQDSQGNDKYTTEVVVQVGGNIISCSGNGSGNGNSNKPASAPQSASAADLDDDSIPF